MVTCNKVCARCGTLKPGVPYVEGMPTSHGICPSCFDDMERDSREWTENERAELRAMISVAWNEEANAGERAA